MSSNETRSVYVKLQKKKFLEKALQKYGQETSSSSFFIFSESSVKRNVRKSAC